MGIARSWHRPAPANGGRLSICREEDPSLESHGPVPLASGTRLGPYEIVTPIGAGGMGEVYRARDLRLQRDVAVKVLPAAFTTDRDRLARFERELRVRSRLGWKPEIIQGVGTVPCRAVPRRRGSRWATSCRLFSSDTAT